MRLNGHSNNFVGGYLFCCNTHWTLNSKKLWVPNGLYWLRPGSGKRGRKPLLSHVKGTTFCVFPQIIGRGTQTGGHCKKRILVWAEFEGEQRLGGRPAIWERSEGKRGQTWTASLSSPSLWRSRNKHWVMAAPTTVPHATYTTFL